MSSDLGGVGLAPDILRLVDSALDATAVVDRQLTLLAFNRAYAELVGVRERELRRVKGHGLCHSRLKLESCTQGECLSAQALRTGRPLRFDQIKSARAGQVLVVSAVPLSGEDGVPFAVLETYRDVTAETRLQERFKALLEAERSQRSTLQEEVERRSAELSEARLHLLQLEKMSSLGLLVAGIAHELNNPINFVSGNVPFVEEHVSNMLGLVELADGLSLTPPDRARLEAEKEARDYAFVKEDVGRLLEAVRSGAERVAAIVGDLRTFSHGGREGTAAPFDLNLGVRTTLSLVAPEAKKRRVALQAELEPLPPLVCVGSHLNQVVMNLVVNALQAVAPGGHVWVRTRLEPGAEPRRVRIEVADDGPGIPKEHQGRVFDPFFTTKDVGTGTGLGLSISLGIVRAHGGSLEVESPPGAGATFRILLPLSPPGAA